MLQLLKALFGKGYLNKIIGTRTNVAKPIKMDKDSPFKKYSDDAFNDPKALEYIEKKINEYGPYALSNKNASEIANFEANAQRLLAAKNKQTGSTPGMAQQIAESMFGPLGKKAKPEADIIDITTQQKIEPEGIMKLKEKLGSPKATETSSSIDNLKEDIAKLTDREARAYSANIESYRRPIIREMLLKDTKIKLPDDVRKSLENKDDLQRGANPEMDPLRLLNEYYDVDFNKLDELEEIRFTARNETEAADEFLKKGGLEPKKDLGDKLKDYDGDPDGLAEGGRIGFAAGGIKALLAMMNKKLGKDVVKTADKIEQPDFAKLKKEFDAFNKRNRKLTEEEYEDLVEEYGEGVPQLETVADAERFVQGQKDYQAAMFRDYKAGKLDPKPGESGRKKFLQQRAEEAEMSGDPRLFTPDDADELMMLQTEKLAPQMTERMQLKIKYPGITDDLIQKIMIDDNPQRKAELLATLDEAYKMVDKGMSSDEILNTIKNTPRTKQADGGLNYLMGL